MKITFLGTGTSQGIPIIGCQCSVCQSNDKFDKRLRTAALIQSHGVTIAIDAGPDFRQQMLRANVKTLDAILLTHEHRDHIAGIDDVRAFNFLMQKPMDIWAEPRVQQSLKSDFSYIFSENKYPGSPEVVLKTISEEPFDIGDIKVIPIRAFHLELPIFGFRFGSLTYITDANHIPDQEKEKIKGSKCLVVNALRKKKHISHFCLPEALELIREINPDSAYLTHISHQMGTHREIQAELPDNIFLAYDGLSIGF